MSQARTQLMARSGLYAETFTLQAAYLGEIKFRALLRSPTLFVSHELESPADPALWHTTRRRRRAQRGGPVPRLCVGRSWLPADPLSP
jgi:hypothetical protein